MSSAPTYPAVSYDKPAAMVNLCTAHCDLWITCVDDFYQALSPEEQARADRFLRREDRDRFVIGATLVRKVCAGYLGIEPRAVLFGRGPFGKPYLADQTGSPRPGLEFNVSHSGNCVTMAWAGGFPVGVDVEVFDKLRPPPFAELADSVFSPDECALLSSVSAADVPFTFYRIWVRKEAVLKAEGCGISALLQSFSTASQCSDGICWPREITIPSSGRTWLVEDFSPASGYAGCVAISREATVQVWNQDILGFTGASPLGVPGGYRTL
ncbi:MAG TPA: 4'-phosphopantetheinyl transferase superfamily protein [Chthoniobacter sp.]|jgi:4'-phosphopantetheinyl transferase